MKKCEECKRKFPEHLIQPFMSNHGNKMLCPLCALDYKNKIHGLNDTCFSGEYAQLLLEEAQEYLIKNKL